MKGMTAASNIQQMATQPVHHRFSLEAYEEMIAHGVFGPDDRVELIAGEIVDKMGQGPRHAWCWARLTRIFVTALGEQALLMGQSPLALPPDSMPEPDIMLIGESDAPFEARRPHANDILLCVEISDSSLRYDRGTKLRLYAQADVAEYWIVDLTSGTVEMYTEPQGDAYTESRTAGIGDTISPRAFPNVIVNVRDIVPADD
jgi:Uma2 family endonuclease